jgi:phytoene desaturase
MQKVVVIGSGFAGLAAACCLAKAGCSVVVLEKNEQLGGRARVWAQDGFTFDMGPSWYWMPDVFEQFFAKFGKRASDYYTLTRLDPSYRIFFPGQEVVDVPAQMPDLLRLFERLEPGSSHQLRRFLEQATFKYRVGMSDYVSRPCLSPLEFLDARLIKESVRLQMVDSTRKHVSKHFRDPRIVQIMEFPVLFLGGTAREIPAMYSLMNYADLVLGTWYPQGGMRQIAEAIIALATELGVSFYTSEPARQIIVQSGRAVGVQTNNAVYPAEVVVGAGDYHHIEQTLLEPSWRTYDALYWDSRVLSPSSLLFYLGINKRLKNLLHHNLFFDEGLDQHADEIYHDARWPQRPLFYACCPSQTDASVAPLGMENLFLLMPVAPGLPDDEATRERYFDLMMTRVEARIGERVRDAVVVKRSYAHKDFTHDYNSYKGNAYGLANLLEQTAFFKPRLQAKKVRNLYFAGQLTVPGPGVPPSLISGQIVSEVILGKT